MDLYFFGTGAGLPSKQRNVTAMALRLHQERNAVWLFDCGEGTQHQMLSSPIRPSKIEKIFITHLHGDHLYGLPGLLGSRAFAHTEAPLTVYGPPGIKHYVETVLSTSETHLPYALDIVEIAPGPVFSDNRFDVSCLPLAHRIASYGYRIVEQPQAGALKVDALVQMGIPKGPTYRALKDGKDVVLPDGRTLQSDDFVMSSTPGRVIAILGDTMPTDNAITLAASADVLVHEATYGTDETARAAKHHHSTTVQAATIAKKAGVRALVLTHLSARYDEAATARLRAEAAAVFANVYIAHDHWTIDIPRPNPLTP